MKSKIRCGMCHRILKNAKSQQLGFGATCYKKWLTIHQYKGEPLFILTKKH